MGKNLQKVQDMLYGNYKNKIQVGYSKTEDVRKIVVQKQQSLGIEIVLKRMVGVIIVKWITK